MHPARVIAPLIASPIFTITLDLHLSGVYPGTIVEIFGSASGSMGKFDWKDKTPDDYVHLERPPVSGEMITATQLSRDGQTSYAYPLLFAPRVKDVPKKIPRPTILSPLHICSSSITLGNLIPGATVQGYVKLDPNEPFIINAVARAEVDTFKLVDFLDLPAGENIKVWQTVIPGTGEQTSRPPTEARIQDIHLPNPPNTPKISPIPKVCETIADIHRLHSGANLFLDNGGKQWYSADGVPEGDYQAKSFLVGLGILSQELTAVQSFPRCNLISKKSEVLVTNQGPPDFPQVAPFNEDADVLYFSHLSPGGHLQIIRDARNFGTVHEIQVVEALNPGHEYMFPLPDEWKPLRDSDPSVKVTISIQQDDTCGTDVTQSAPIKPGKAVQVPKLKIDGPVYESASFIEVSGVEPSLSVSLVDENDTPLSLPISSNSSTVRIHTIVELQAGQTVFAKQTQPSEKNQWRSDRVMIQSLPLEAGLLPRPEISKSLKEGSQQLVVENLLGGARVSVYVDKSMFTKEGNMWNSSFSAVRETEVLYLSSPLVKGQSVLVVQSLGAYSSSLKGRGKIVRGAEVGEAEEREDL